MTPDEIEALLREAQKKSPVVIRTFTAEYESECDCGEMILPGNEAGYIDGDTRASCSDCCDDAVSP